MTLLDTTCLILIPKSMSLAPISYYSPPSNYPIQGPGEPRSELCYGRRKERTNKKWLEESILLETTAFVKNLLTSLPTPTPV